MTRPDRRAVAAWLFLCAALTFAIVVVGGITRLTESGLSIVEWQPLAGAIPPLSDADWQALFARYQETPQYRKVFSEIGLEGFKNIFWWEYAHRLLGRTIGLVFLLPFLFFLIQGKLTKTLAWKLGGLFVLGGLQGAMGWYMVKSGLVDDPRVSHFRLTAHLGLALLIFSLELWLAFEVWFQKEGQKPRRLALAVAGAVFLMALSGGFVAGLRAGHAYNTFPLMNGALVPPEAFMLEPWWRNFLWNVATVQLVHRTLFWALLLLVPFAWWKLRAGPARIAAHHLLAMFLLQASLGISTLLLAVPIPLAAAHQAGAVLLLACALWTAHATRRPAAPAADAARRALNAGRLEVAQAAMNAGVLPGAAGLAELVLRSEPSHPQALAMLARVDVALRAGGGADAAGGPERYLVIKAWGHGFWSEVSHVLGGLLLAELTRRTPVVHWGSNGLFGAFDRYFERVSRATLAQVAALEGADFFPAKWHRGNLEAEDLQKWDGDGARLGAIQFLHRPERVAVADFFLSVASLARWIPAWHPLAGKSVEAIYRDLIRRHLKPAADVTALCDAFVAQRLAGRPFAAVHLRGSDKAQEATDVAERNEQVIALARQLPSDLPVLLLTDDANYAARMRSILGERLVLPDAERAGGDTGVHFTAGGDPVRRGLEVMRDTYLALRAERFLGNGYSNVAGMVALMRDWPAGACMLVAPPYLLQFQPVLYMPLDLARRYGVAQPDELVGLAR